MKDLAKRFGDNWKARKFPTSGTLLLALSGGIDSMTLAHLLKAIGVSFAAAHCNFSLRGKDSDEDEAFVQHWCNANGVTCHATTFHTNTIATQRRQSIQVVARELRYEWFNKLLHDH